MTHPRRREQPPRSRLGHSKKTAVQANGTCARSGKRRFVTERDAVKAAANIKRLNPHKKRKPMPVYRYQCPSCKDWHLTNVRGGDVTNRPEPTELPKQPTIGGAR